MRRLGVLVLTGALLAVASPARAAPTSAALARELRTAVAAGAPGIVVLTRDGSRTLRLAAGVGNRARHTPMRVGDRFRVGSVTKTFMAAIVLQLAGEGRLSLDDTVERWLPGLVPNGAAITVRELLNHTSGLYDYLNDGDLTIIAPYLKGDFGHVWAPRDLVAAAVKHPAHFAPGTAWAYSNTGYVVLGMIVEAATGQTVGAELQQRIFGPLGLRRTSFDTAQAIAGPHAHGYFRLPRQPLIDVTALSPTIAYAAGAIVSTAGDLATFYRALLGGRLLRPDLLAAMETTVSVGQPGAAYGLGLVKLRVSCAAAAWGHDGDFPGYLTWAFNSRDARHQVVVMVNDDALNARATRAVEHVLATGFCA
jgi:D-alanyl-D-alanine carboxypeptidase